MATWIERYKAGECAEVWAEIEAGKPVNRKLAAPVVKETMERCRRNVLWLFEALPQIGYRFAGSAEPSEPDYPLELRISGALEYVAATGGRKYRSNPWAHPAFAWMEEEEIELPAHHRNGRPGRANYRGPGARTSAKLDALEPLPIVVRSWFETVGSVDLAGTHPMLNPRGEVASLRIVVEEMPVEDSAGFVARVRHAFAWAGFPGWSGRDDIPERELKWLRGKLEAV